MKKSLMYLIFSILKFSCKRFHGSAKEDWAWLSDFLLRVCVFSVEVFYLSSWFNIIQIYVSTLYADL